MSVSGAIRAGAAYVEVFLDQNRLTAGLRAVQSKLRGWSASLGRLGGGAFGALPGPLGAMAQFATSPAGVLSGLLLAAKNAASFGTELDILSQKTGIAHKTLGALEYAAAQSGVNVQSLGVGIRQLAKNTYDAARGSKEPLDAFRALGVDAEELARRSPDEQLRLMADRLLAIENPSLRAALAMKVFGRSGVDLLPLLVEGSEGIGRLMDDARKLGLTMGGAEARRLREFGDRVDDLWLAAKRAAVSIGSALTPELRGAAVWFSVAAKTTKDWIEAHKGVVVAALRASAAIVAGGAALSLFGKLLGLAAGSVGLLLVPFRLVAGLAGLIGSTVAGAVSMATGALSAAGGALMFLLTPIGLLTAAAVGLAGYFLWSSGAIGKAFDWLKGVFMNLADDARTALGAIGDALAAGDMALAAQVLWALLKLEWQKGIAYLEGVWEDFKGFWSDAVTGLAIIFNNVTAKIKTFWAEMLGWMQKKWEAFKVSGFSETLANMLAPIFARIQGVSVEATREALKEDFARGRKTLPAQTDEIDAQTRAKTGQIERDRQATEDELARDKVRADKARQARIAAAQAEADAARKEFEAAVAAARRARETATPKALTTPAIEKPTLPDLANLAAVKASVTGTFSSAVWGLGTGSDAAEETAKNTRDMVGIVRDTRDIMRRQELGGAGILLG